MNQPPFIRLTDKTINLSLVEWIEWNYEEESIDPSEGTGRFFVRIVFAQDSDEIFIPLGSRDEAILQNILTIN